MVEFMLLPDLSNDIVQDHIMLKLMEPILTILPCAIDVIKRNNVICYDMVFLCIYKCLGVHKAWRLHFGMGEVHNAL